LCLSIALAEKLSCPAQETSDACPQQAETSYVPCRSACVLKAAHPACAAGLATQAAPCGVYSCFDVFGRARACDPLRDNPPPEPDTRQLEQDTYGCDNQLSENKPWSKQICKTSYTVAFSNSTCPWVDKIRGWSTVKGQLMCSDGSLCNTTDSPAVGGGDSCCNTRGGRLRCPIDLPYMCDKVGECADAQDRCCLALPENCNTAANNGLRACNTTVTHAHTSCQLDGCLLPAQLDAGGEAVCAAVSQKSAINTSSSSSDSLQSGRLYQQVLGDFQVDLKCLTCIRNGCQYCQILVVDPPNASLAPSSSSLEATQAQVFDALLASAAASATASATEASAAGASSSITRDSSKSMGVVGVLRLSERARCISDRSVCARISRLARADTTGVALARESEGYASEQ